MLGRSVTVKQLSSAADEYLLARAPRASLRPATAAQARLWLGIC